MNIGFIGTGKIAYSVITGIFSSKIIYKKIIISPRNKETAKKLKIKFNTVKIAKNNQEILNSCEWIFLIKSAQQSKLKMKNLQLIFGQLLE